MNRCISFVFQIHQVLILYCIPLSELIPRVCTELSPAWAPEGYVAWDWHGHLLLLV